MELDADNMTEVLDADGDTIYVRRSGWESLLAPWSSTCRHGGPSTAVPPAAGEFDADVRW